MSHKKANTQFIFVGESHHKPSKSNESVEEEVVSFLRALPQGEEDWDNNKPETDEELQRLRQGLTLSTSLNGQTYTKQERAEWSWIKLMSMYAKHMALIRPVDGPERQMYDIVFSGLCSVGLKVGNLSVEEVHNIMRIVLTDTDNMLSRKRLAVPKYIEILNVLESFLMGERAHEIPMRRKFLNRAHCFTPRHYDVLICYITGVRKDDKFHPYMPRKLFPSGTIRIIDLIFELCGGEFRKIPEVLGRNRTAASKSLRPFTSEDVRDHLCLLRRVDSSYALNRKHGIDTQSAHSTFMNIRRVRESTKWVYDHSTSNVLEVMDDLPSVVAV